MTNCNYLKYITGLLIFLVVVASCKEQAGLSKPGYTRLDSLLGFDTIISIYTNSELPPKISDDIIEGKEPVTTLHVDTVNRWTNNAVIIDSIRRNFPKLVVSANMVWETTCCGSEELILQTKTGGHFIYWLNLKDSGGVKVNDAYYKTDREQLDRLIKLLDRQIIRKEIYLADSIHYSLDDYYNKRNKEAYADNSGTRYIYILN